MARNIAHLSCSMPQGSVSTEEGWLECGRYRGTDCGSVCRRRRNSGRLSQQPGSRGQGIAAYQHCYALQKSATGHRSIGWVLHRCVNLLLGHFTDMRFWCLCQKISIFDTQPVTIDTLLKLIWMINRCKFCSIKRRFGKLDGYVQELVATEESKDNRITRFIVSQSYR